MDKSDMECRQGYFRHGILFYGLSLLKVKRNRSLRDAHRTHLLLVLLCSLYLCACQAPLLLLLSLLLEEFRPFSWEIVARNLEKIQLIAVGTFLLSSVSSPTLLYSTAGGKVYRGLKCPRSGTPITGGSF